VFLRPANLGMRIVGRGTGVVFSVLRKATGVDLLSDLSVFFRALGGMIDGFRERAERVNELLADPGTTFLIVTSAEREPIDEAIYFWRKLRAARMPFGGVVVNKVHHDLLGADADDAALAEALTEQIGDEKLARSVAQTTHDYHVLARRDEANIARLAERLDEDRIIRVPHLDDDVHDVEGLLALHRYLFASEAERERLLAGAVA
jgi:anion-transporting  ArsA/GET3 family ATPase